MIQEGSDDLPAWAKS